ncbi:MAG: TRAP transporter small permease [Mogibacterium sp.]|nr:TRAP transporter small permease [Mogibacterium sp.]
MEKVREFYTKVCDKLALAGGIIVFLLCLLLFVNVVLRRIFQMPITGAIEAVQYGMLFAVCIAIGKTTFEKGHIVVELIVDSLPPKPRKVLQIITGIVGIAIFAFFVVIVGGMIGKVKMSGQVSSVLGIPQYIVYIALIFGMVMVIISLVILFIELVMTPAKGKEEN